MRLATIRTPYGNQAIRIDGEGIGTALDFEDVGQLLHSPQWPQAAGMSGEPVAFLPEDLAPVIPAPGKIICVEDNYTQYGEEEGATRPGVPTLSVKFADALTGPYDPVQLPPHAQAAADYEGELAVVIGKYAHNVAAQGAADYVAGYAIINDYTLRDVQHATSQFHAGKSFYRSAGFGPWLTTSTDWSPGRGARLSTTVDGELRQEASTADLVFSVAALIEYCSSLYPLHPGDVIATGTPPGSGFPSRCLTNGATTRVTIEGLGHISNRTVFSAAAPSAAGASLIGQDLLGRDLPGQDLLGQDLRDQDPGEGESGCCGGNCGCGK